MFTAMPAHAARSVTADNGSEFAYRYRLADTLGIPTYFADLTQTELDEFSTEINNRPRRILGWAIPAEIFQELSSNQTTTTCCTPN